MFLRPPQNGEGTSPSIMLQPEYPFVIVRFPCPALKSLANHGICPRSGKGFTIPVVIDCLKRGLNVRADFPLSIVSTAVRIGS